MIILMPKYFMTTSVQFCRKIVFWEKKLHKAFNNLTTSSVWKDLTC